MSKIYTSADQLIGKTPLLELSHIEKAEKPSSNTSTPQAPSRIVSPRPFLMTLRQAAS